MEKDLVYLVWTDVKTGNKYKVAMLYKENETYYFKYILEKVKEAQKDGLPVVELLSHKYALADINEAMEMNISMKGLKIVVMGE